MQARKADKICVTKSRIRFLTGLCLLCSGLLFPVLSASGLPLGGLTAEGNISFGSSISVDSFDSSNPSYSSWQTNLFYNGVNYGIYTNTLRSDQAMVAADNNVTLVAGVIYGYVNTGPGKIVTLIGGGSSVGDLAWIGPDPSSPLDSGVEPGHAFDDMAVIFNDAVLPTPTNAWLSPAYYSSGTNINGVSYYYLITNVVGKPGTPTNRIYYALNPVSGRGSIFVNASNVVLYLTNGISMKNGNALTVNTNSSLIIYSGGTFDTGYGSVNNLTQFTPTLKIYGLPTCSSVIFGAVNVLGVWLYAPEASVTFQGGGTFVDVVGAFICHDFTANGHYNFHLDQIFTTNAPVPAWILRSPTNQIAPLGSNATFAVYTGGDFPLYEQWFLNQTNLVSAGTNLFALFLTNVQFSDAGNYSVIVTNLYGSVTSAPASLIVYSNATPTLTIDSASTNGQFQFDILGVNGLNYSVEASSNLIDWVPLATNVSPFTFIDTNSTAFPQRFYRSVFTH